MKEETKCYCGHTTYCDCGPETLEEATELFFRKKDVKNCTLYKAAKLGAKWQQERSYSKEDMKKAFYYGYCCENKYGVGG